MMSGPRISAAVAAHLAGRPLVLRASPRNGCCGGRALVPVAEVGPPADLDAYRRVEIGSVPCFVDHRLGDQVETWRVELVGFGRWRRLHLVDTHGVDPTRCEEHRDA